MNANRVCEALDLDPADLADVCKREAARRLKGLAAVLGTAMPVDPDQTTLVDASHWLRLARQFEIEWERRNPVDDGDGPASSTERAVAAGAKPTGEDWLR